MKYVPALDGVRCLAVLMVAAYHFFIFGAGWVGVQVFFVLSGFLITSILLESKATHRDSYFRRFYWRRTLRIFPLYFAYVGLTAVSFVVLAVPHEFGELWAYLVTYTSNFTRTWTQDRGGEFFVHFWSLAVEEQFYLVWPLVVFLLSREALRRTVLCLLIGVPLLRLGLGEYFLYQGFEPDQVVRIVGVLTPTQFDAFAAGAALVLFDATSWRRPERLAVAGLAVWLIAGAIMLATVPGRGWSPDTLGHHSTVVNYYHVWGNALTNLASAAVILAALQGHFAALFQNRLAIHVGKVSYGVYVLHLPAVYILKNTIDYRHASLTGLAIFCAYFALVVAMATLSYRFFEQPFLRLKDRMGRQAPAPIASTVET